MNLVRWCSTIPLKLRTLFRQGRVERELDEEVQYHLDRKIEVYMARGLSPADARAAAIRDFGGVEARKEDCRDARGWVLWVEQSRQDALYAVRTLRRAPGFAIVAIATLALGIGANTAIFSLLNGVLLKPLSLPDVHQLIQLQLVDEQGPDPQMGIGPKARFSYPAFSRFADTLPPDSSLIAMSRIGLLHVRFETRRAVRGTFGQLVSGAYFSALGVRPSLGRLLDDTDNRQIDGHPVGVISYGLWQELGALPTVIGQAITINGLPITIVGVAEEGFRGVWADTGTELWLPVSMQHAIGYRQNYSVSRGQFDAPWLPQDGVAWLTLVARVPDERQQAFAAATDAVHRAGILALAQELRIPDDRVAAALATRRVLRVPFAQGLSALRPQFASPLFVLMGLVLLVLAVACANVANLLLARGIARSRELGIRLSLGASRLRVVRQLLVESVLLALIGGAAGLLVGGWVSRGVASLVLADPMPLDWRVLAFSVGLSLASTLLFGIAPAFGAARLDPARVIGAASKGTSTAVGLGRMKPLVAGQVCVTFVVVVGAVLFGRTLVTLAAVEPGFERHQLVGLTLNPFASGYARDDGPAVQRRLLEHVRAASGVVSVTMASCQLAAGCRNNQSVRFEGYVPGPEERVQAQVADVGADYFETVGMTLVEGRAIDSRDIESGAAVAVINEQAARRYFGEASPVGKRAGRGLEGPLRFEIIGVVRDARINDLTEAAVPTAFVPLPPDAPGPWSLNVRVAGDPDVMLRELQASLNRAEPSLLVERASTIEAQLQQNLTRQRLVAYLAGAFGGLTLLLACIGLYGVMAYGVARRTAEMGIRLAFGAKPVDLLRGILAEGAWLAGSGMLAGVLVSLWATRSIGTLLYGVNPNQPIVYAIVAVILTGTVLLACLIPASRAARVDPVRALRSE